MSLMRSLERVSMVVGIALVGFYLGVRIQGELSSRLAVLAFQEVQAKSAGPKAASENETVDGVNVGLWSESRIAAFKQSLAQHFRPPEAVLRIPSIHLEVPVFDGTNDLILNRGVGRISGTARVGMPGNIGIAGHRDGFFRGLKDIHTGDTLMLVTPNKTEKYVVDDIQIVSPDDVGVLKSGPVSSLTLVTCYPFYFVGSAPRRYIVHASLFGSAPSGAGADKQFTSKLSSENPQEKAK
ncbi:MAG TPA: class D sortase [Acidobacteriaceae bacterium]|nr:class D sortase [Acidobacteriaceae bacterium]